MLSFAEFPTLLQFTDNDIRIMSLEDIEIAFTHASKMLLNDELKRWQQCMWSAIERARNHSSNATMQKVLDHLEEYKRNLGRQYSVQHNMRTLLKYNEVERDIRWLTAQYVLKRKSRPYFLDAKY